MVLRGESVVDTDVAGARSRKRAVVLAVPQVFPSPNRDAERARNGCTVLADGRNCPLSGDSQELLNAMRGWIAHGPWTIDAAGERSLDGPILLPRSLYLA